MGRIVGQGARAVKENFGFWRSTASQAQKPAVIAKISNFREPENRTAAADHFCPRKKIDIWTDYRFWPRRKNDIPLEIAFPRAAKSIFHGRSFFPEEKYRYSAGLSVFRKG
jgi:hypothetical protein